MELRNVFYLPRFLLLLRLELFRCRKAIGMMLVITLGILILLGLLLDIIVRDIRLVYDHHDNYAASMLIGGFILSSLAFTDLASPLKGSHYLTLPASAFEKFLSMWFLTSVGWVVLYTLIFWVYTLLVNPVATLLFHAITFKPFEPFGDYALTVILYYFTLQGIFLVAASHFKGYVFAKTVFALVLFILVIGIISYFLMRNSFLVEHECTGERCVILEAIEVHPAWLFVKSLFWWTLAPLCWIMTYLGIKEKEV
jgi:hypothetical protein